MPSGNPSPRVIKGNGGRRLKVQDGDEDLADLQRRFTALEDEARIAPPAAQITPRSTLRTQRERSTAAAVRADNETELSRLDEQITTLRRKHDELAHANMEKRRELEKLTDRLQDLSKEAIMPSEEDNATMKEIRALEARLQKAVAKYEDAYEVRRTYEQIVKRARTPTRRRRSSKGGRARVFTDAAFNSRLRPQVSRRSASASPTSSRRVSSRWRPRRATTRSCSS